MKKVQIDQRTLVPEALIQVSFAFKIIEMRLRSTLWLVGSWMPANQSVLVHVRLTKAAAWNFAGSGAGRRRQDLMYCVNSNGPVLGNTAAGNERCALVKRCPSRRHAATPSSPRYPQNSWPRPKGLVSSKYNYNLLVHSYTTHGMDNGVESIVVKCCIMVHFI